MEYIARTVPRCDEIIARLEAEIAELRKLDDITHWQAKYDHNKRAKTSTGPDGEIVELPGDYAGLADDLAWSDYRRNLQAIDQLGREVKDAELLRETARKWLADREGRQ
jgi:hypothetical protein